MNIQRFGWQRSIVGLVFVCVVFWCAPRDTVNAQAPDREAVLALVEKLQSRSFKTRQDSAEALWRMGPQIEPILIESLADSDLESRQRIKSIRFRFELGLTPEMPPETRSLIMTAINSNSDKQRREAASVLAGKSEFRAVMVILNRLKTAREQSDYFSLIMVATRKLEPSEELDGFHFKMLHIAIAQANARDRARSIYAVLRDTQIRRRATTKDWIERLIKLVSDCPNAATRKNVIDSVYFDSTALRKVVDADILAKWIDLVAVETDRSIRYRHVSKVLSTSQLLRNSSTSVKQIDVEALFNQLTPSGRNALVDVASNVPSALQMLHEQVGDLSLLSAAAATGDPVIRGNLRGRLASLPSWPKKDAVRHGVLGLIDQEVEGPARQQVVVGFLEGLARQGGSAKPKATEEITSAIWSMLNTKEAESWQLVALLETYGSPLIFGSRHNAETIHRMLRLAEKADRRPVHSLSFAPISKPHLASEIAKHKLALHYVVALNKIPHTSTNVGLYSSLLGSQAFTKTFADKTQRRDLIKFCDQLQGRSGYYAVSGILRNTKFLTQLVDEGHFDNLKSMVANVQKANTRSDLLPKLLASSPAIRYLAKSQRLDEVWEPGNPKETTLRDSVLRYIVISDDSVGALIEAKQYVRLLAVIEEVESEPKRKELLRNLRTRKGFAKKMLEQGGLGDQILALSREKSWISRRGYSSLIASLTLQDVRKEPTLAGKMLKFARTIEVERDRQEFLRALVSTQWFLVQLTKQDLLVSNIDWIVKNVTEKRYSLALRGLLSTHPKIFLEEDRISVFAMVIRPMSEEQQVASISSFCGTSHFWNWLEKEKDPLALIRQLDAIKDDEMRGRMASGFFGSAMLSRLRGKEALIAKLIDFAARQTDPSRLELAVALLTHYSTAEQSSKSQLVDLVAKRLDGPPIAPGVLKRMVGTHYLLQSLKIDKKERKLIDLVLAIPQASQRDDCLLAAMLNSRLSPSFNDKELAAAVDPLLRKQSSVRFLSIASSPTLMGRLIKMGYFDRLREYADNYTSAPQNVSLMQVSFFTNSAVTSELSKRNENADVLVRLLQRTPPTSVKSRAMQVLSHPQTVLWLIRSHGWKPLKNMLDRGGDKARDDQMLQYLSMNPTLMHALDQRGELSELMKELDLDDSGMRSRLMRSLTSATVCDQLKHDVTYFDLLTDLVNRETDSKRRNVLTYAMRTTSFQNCAMKHGKGKWLFETLAANANVSPEQRKTDFASSRGLYALAIRHGQFDAAQGYLQKMVDDDVGKLRLIRFCLIRSLFDETYSFAVAKTLSGSDRYAYYYARAAGERIPIEDPALQWCDAMERHQWSKLRDQAVLRSKQLPVPRTTADINPDHRRLEEMGFKISMNQLSGESDQDGIQELVDWIAKHGDDSLNARYGADALLAVGQPTQALQLLDKQLPRRAFYWHWSRLDYDRALESIGWTADTTQTLFDNIAGDTKGNSTKRRGAVSFLLQVAKCLNDAGHDQEVLGVIKTLADFAGGLSDADRKSYSQALAMQLYAAGFKSQSFQVIAESLKENETPKGFFSGVYRDSKHYDAWEEAAVWWSAFKLRHSEDSVVRRLQRVDKVMKAVTPIKELRPLPDGDGNPESKASDRVLVTRYRYGLYAQVRERLQAKKKLERTDRILMGRALFAEQKYRLAAESFYGAWKAVPSDLTRLYLAGHCLEKAGNRAEDRATSNQYKMTAMLSALSMQGASGLAAGLNHEGLTEDGLRIYDVLRRTAPPGHRYYLYPVYRIAAATKDPMVAVPLRTEYSIHHLRPIVGYTDVPLWIHLATRLQISKAEKAAEERDFTAVEKHWRDATRIDFANQWIAKSIVPRLRENKQPELADRILNAHREYLQARVKRYPNSPVVSERLQALRELTKAAP